MIPVRVLLVEESLPVLRGVTELLDECGGFEVYSAVSPAAGMLSLARMQPDLLILHPFAGRGTAEEWRRAVNRYRVGRALSTLVLADRISDHDRELLEEIADLGIRPRRPGPGLLEAILAGWAGEDVTCSRAG